jgi:hypothetical protein
MANSVYSTLYFEQISEAGEKRLEEILSRIKDTEERRWFADIFVDGKEGSPSHEDTQTYNFMTERVGPKWCFVEDIDGTSIRTESAWTWPEEAYIWMLDQIAEVDKNFIAIATYEDEGPNFIGAAIYTAAGLYEYFEYDADEIHDAMIQRVEGLKEHWLEEDEMFDDEGTDMFYDNLYDIVEELQTQFIDEWVSDLRSALADEET